MGWNESFSKVDPALQSQIDSKRVYPAKREVKPSIPAPVEYRRKGTKAEYIALLSERNEHLKAENARLRAIAELGPDLILEDLPDVPPVNNDLEWFEREQEERAVTREVAGQTSNEINPGLAAIARARDSYIGMDGRKYISAGKTESYGKITEDDYTGGNCYDGI